MNPLYNQLFNPQYANQDYLQHLHWQQHDTEQRQEIMNAVKAIHDYFDSARKIASNAARIASATYPANACGASAASSFSTCLQASETDASSRDKDWLMICS